MVRKQDTDKAGNSRPAIKKATAARPAKARSSASSSRGKKTSTRASRATKAPAAKASRGQRASRGFNPDGRQLVIVESPTKAKTVNRYLGQDFIVLASVGHVRDLPTRAPKGVKQEVPGVDLERDFRPTYEILPAKQKTVRELKAAAGKASDVWFATDLDREGEAIAWHLAQALGVDPAHAKRVVFNAITRAQIEEAFQHPRPIDENKVNAQQARRILDRIVGYQVSPLLWKKVAGGLSAGRVQSVAVRLVVEREREIEAFVPEELWRIAGVFTTDLDHANDLARSWAFFLGEADPDKQRTVKDRLAWLADHDSFRAELVEVGSKPFEAVSVDQALEVARQIGFEDTEIRRTEDPKGKGPAKNRILVLGKTTGADRKGKLQYQVKSIETKRVKSRPSPPFITSTMQQAASNALGYPLKRTMRIAQQLYEGIDLRGGGGQTGLITYMRTDSVFVSPEAIAAVREYVGQEYGAKFLPEKPNYYTTKVQAAQEAHEAIRPTDVRLTPARVRASLTDEQFRLYELIWKRFVASQMVAAEWDSTTVMVAAMSSGREAGVFKASGRILAFEGFYKASGVPKSSEEATLPVLSQDQELAPLQIEPTQHFTSPPPRYNEASLQKKLEEEGIGRPSTYASIISTIQERKYVEPVVPRDRKLRATDLGKVVTDKLVEAFPEILDVAYTRYMESELDKIEEERHDWVAMLHEFYGPFRESLDRAHDEMVHAKAETEPAPHTCPDCGAGTMFRFGRNGRFLSCATYPDCKYAAPIDSEGNPMEPEQTDIACPSCGSGMTLRSGRFGKFLGCVNYPECKGILNLDPKKGTIKLPKTPPFITDLPCPKCESPLNMRDSKRGFWLSCSKFPKCRGRLAWSAVPIDKQKALAEGWDTHVREHPLPEVRTVEGEVVGEEHVPMVFGQDSDSSGEYAEAVS